MCKESRGDTKIPICTVYLFSNYHKMYTHLQKDELNDIVTVLALARCSLVLPCQLLLLSEPE